MAEPRAVARVVGVGHVAIDHMFSLPAAPVAGAKQPAQRYRALVGGMTANACVAAARLGGAVRLASPVGDDDAWLAPVRAHLAREGVDASALVRVPGAGGSVSAVLVDADGGRTIVNHRGDALARAPAFDARVLDDADILLTDPRCVTWADAALRAARRAGLASVLDADASPRADLQRLAGLADWAVFSEPGAAAYVDGTDDDALAGALAAGARVAVVTHGPHGLRWQRAGAPPRTLAAYPVAPVVDSTAAGDVFHGALAVALAEGRGDEAALRFAAAAAALKCLQPDGVLGAPRREAVMALLDERP